MLTVLILGIEVFMSFLLQSTVFVWLSVGHAVPDLLLIVTVAAGYQNSRITGMVTGFFCGLLLDISSGGVLGIYALFYMLIGYTCGKFNKYYIQRDWFVPLGLIAAAEFALCTLIYIFGYLINGDTRFLRYVRSIFLPKMLYTVIIAIVYYLILTFLYEHVINRNAEDEAFLAPESIVPEETK